MCHGPAGGTGSTPASGSTGGGGGGGAGGWKGGDGGGAGKFDILGGGGGGGGGGGSSYASVANPSFYDGVGNGNGEVQITANTSTALASSVNPSTPGQQVTYTATVSPAPTTGTVDFTDGGQAIPGCGGLPPNAQTGVAACPVTYSATGSHTIQAEYLGGGALYGDSTSNTVTQVVVSSIPTGTTVTTTPPPAPDVFIADTGNNQVVRVPAGGGPQTAVGTGLTSPEGVAVDAKGRVFIADTGNNRVVRVGAGGGSQTTVGTGLNQPGGVAVDTKGRVFIADTDNNRVVRVGAGGGSQTTVGTGLDKPGGVAVDAAGDVYIADTFNNRVVEVPANGTPQTTIGTGLNSPYGVGVDAAGDVYIADTFNNRVVEVPANGTPQTTIGSGLSGPTGVEVDAAGDVYIADHGNGQVVEVPAGGQQTTIGSGLSSPFGVAVDVPPTATTFGTPVTLKATVIPTSGPTGSVTFKDTANGATTVLGSAGLSAGTATFTGVLPAVGTNSIVASYSGGSGDGASTSAPIRVQVAPTAHLLAVTQARFSGPGQAGTGAAGDWYIDLVDNSAFPLSLAGWHLKVVNASDTVEPIALPTVTLPAGGAFLVAGSQYSLGTVATPDLTITTLNGTILGSQLAPPASAKASPTDQVGDTTAPAGYQGSAGGLGAVSGLPTVQYAFVRHGTQAAPTDTNNNAGDFSLVTTAQDSTVGGQPALLGSPSPLSATSPQQINAAAQSRLLQPSVSAGACPNRISTAGSPATLLVNRTITNTTGRTLTRLWLRITSVTEKNGPPDPSSGHAWLRLVSSSSAVYPNTSCPAAATSQTVGASTASPVSATLGGGLGTTLNVPLPLQANGQPALLDGQSVNVAILFDVDQGGAFSFGYDVDGS